MYVIHCERIKALKGNINYSYTSRQPTLKLFLSFFIRRYFYNRLENNAQQCSIYVLNERYSIQCDVTLLPIWGFLKFISRRLMQYFNVIFIWLDARGTKFSQSHVISLGEVFVLMSTSNYRK